MRPFLIEIQILTVDISLCDAYKVNYFLRQIWSTYRHMCQRKGRPLCCRSAQLKMDEP